MVKLDPGLVNVKLAAYITWFGMKIVSFIENYDGDIMSELVDDMRYEADTISIDLNDRNLSADETIEKCVRLATILFLKAMNAQEEKP